jgi:hypothetical protein
MIKTYHELKKMETFEERYRYLRLNRLVGQSTFGYDRIFNQLFYNSDRWRRTRDGIIIRDNACDLGVKDHEIYDIIIVHHINPITIEDIELDCEELYDPEYLICTAFNTHNAIHYGDEKLLPTIPIERRKNDTCPWR